MTDMTKNLSYYESLPYTVVVRRDEEGDFVAKIQELPGCVAHGENEAVAIEQLRSMQKLWLEDALSGFLERFIGTSRGWRNART
jgi:antitoxin HicB